MQRMIMSTVPALALALVLALAPVGCDSSSGSSEGPAADTSETEFESESSPSVACTGAALTGVPDDFPKATTDCPLRLDISYRMSLHQAWGRDKLTNVFEDEPPEVEPIDPEDLAWYAGSDDDSFSASIWIPKPEPGTYYGGNAAARETRIDEEGHVVEVGPDGPEAHLSFASFVGENFVTSQDRGAVTMNVRGIAGDVVWGDFDGEACDFLNATAVGSDVVYSYDCVFMSGKFTAQFAQ